MSVVLVRPAHFVPLPLASQVSYSPGGSIVATDVQAAIEELDAEKLSAVVEDTTPQLGGHLDVNGQVLGDGSATLLSFVEQPGAVNNLEVENSISLGGPTLRAVGSDIDVDLHLHAKGNGTVHVDTNLEVDGNIVVFGSVDGRDIAADGTKLDGIEAGAAAPPYGTTDLSDNAVTDTKLRDSAALSVIGRSVNSVGDPADIAAPADGAVLRRAGTVLGFGTLGANSIANNAIVNTKLAQMLEAHVKGRAAGAGTGNTVDLTADQLRAIVAGFSVSFPTVVEIPFTILFDGAGGSTATFAHGLTDIDTTQPVMVIASVYNAGLTLNAFVPGLVVGFGPTITLSIFRLGANLEFRASQDLSTWSAVALVAYTPT
jgi:hypothetical protein